MKRFIAIDRLTSPLDPLNNIETTPTTFCIRDMSKIHHS